MFDFVNRKKTIVQIVLFIALLPFLFWGLESYQGMSGASSIATVNGEEISRQEYEQALHNQQENLRNMLGDNFDASMLDNPQARMAALENLIQQKILRHEAAGVGLTVLDSRITSEIQNLSLFHEDDKFSYERYRELLQRQGISPAIFEARLAADLMRQQLVEGVSSSVIISKSVADKVATLSETTYEINRATINPEQYLEQIEPDEEAIQIYYDSHQQDFILPERVRVEYAVLSLDELAKQELVSDEEIKTYFDERQDEFSRAEERKASHILMLVPADATEEQKASIKDKIEQVLEQIKQEPEAFSELAKELSEDPGSAKMGGDLGFFARGSMVKEFEDAVFAMQPDEISEVIETPFGFHIIKLTAVKDAGTADFDEVEDVIKQMLQRHKVAERFGELSEDFSNIVYEQGDTLQPVAQLFNLTLQQSDWIDRRAKEPSALANERVLQAIFSDSAIKDRYNTEAIEIAPDTLVSARVLEHRPESMQSVELVKGEIIAALKQQFAIEAAEKDGEQKLAELQAGETDNTLKWGEATEISYLHKKGGEEEILHAMFRTNVEKLPAYTGLKNRDGGFDLIRINQVKVPTTEESASQHDILTTQLQQVYSREELGAYLAGLRQRYDVEITSLEEEDD